MKIIEELKNFIILLLILSSMIMSIGSLLNYTLLEGKSELVIEALIGSGIAITVALLLTIYIDEPEEK